MPRTQLHIYDLDETLYFPDRGTARGFYQAVGLRGIKGPGYNNRWHIPNVLEARRSATDPRVVTVLLTARPHYRGMKKVVVDMLQAARIDMDVIQLKPVVYPGTDPQYKAAAVQGWLAQMPDLRKVVFHDDLQPNLDAVGALVRATGREYVGIKV